MVSYKDLEMLQRYRPEGDGHVLSLYLDVDQSKPGNLNRGFERTVNQLLKEAERDISNHLRAEFETNREKVLRFVRDYTPRKKSLVIFSDARRGFWWDRDLPIALPSVARFAPAPYYQPLVEALDEYERYGVVLVDKGRARLFTVYLGDVEEHHQVFDEVPRRTVTTSTDRLWSQKNLQRHHDQHVHGHVKNVAEKLTELAAQYHFDRLVLGGTVEAVSELQRVLPKALRSRVVGTLSAPITASVSDILAEVQKIEAAAERDRELEIVERLVTTAHKGGNATIGAADTIQAVSEGRVWRLVYARNSMLQGAVCTGCGALYLDAATGSCLYCGGSLEATSQLLDRAIERVLARGGAVEELRGPAAEKLAALGCMGAFLRF